MAVMLCGASVTPALAVDLNEALAQAYAGNPTLEAARAQLRATDERVPEALSGWRPTVIGQAEGGKTWIEQNTPLLLDQNLESRTFGVTVSQPVFSGFETVSSTSAAEKPGIAASTSIIGTLICGSSSRGSWIKANAPSSNDATTSSGVSLD